MSFENIKEFFKNHPKYQEWVNRYSPDRLSATHMHTKNFGAVKIRDYNNPRYAFLARDNGVPTMAQEFSKDMDEVSRDVWGKPKRTAGKKSLTLRVIAPEFIEWDARQNRIARIIRDDEAALDVLADESWRF